MKPLRTLTLVACVSLPCVAFAQAAPPKPVQLPSDSMEIGRKYTAFFYQARFDSLLAHMKPEERTENTKAQLQGNLAQLTSRAGQEQKVLRENFYTRNGARQYWRTAQFSGTDEPILVRFVIAPNGELRGMGLGTAADAPSVDP